MGKRKKIIIISSAIIGSIILILLILSTVFGLLNEKSNKIINGVSINNIDVSKLSKEEAKEKLNNIAKQKINEDIILKYKDGEYEEKINEELLNIEYNIEESIEEAYLVGRGNSVIVNNFNILKTKFYHNNININVSYDEDEMQNIIDNINEKIPGAIKQMNYYIEDSNIIITRGKEGLAVINEELKENLKNILSNFNDTKNTIEIPVANQKPDDIDIEKIYQEIHKEAKNAYYQTNPFQIYPHVTGVDFSISLEEAKELLKELKEEYVIPLKITTPEITTDKLGTAAFPEQLSTFATNYKASDKARTTNLIIASKKINGTVIMPGETFSYNKALGERTISAGYKEAKIYENGKVVNGLGGGICQISSTLYNSVLLSNLEIVSRKNHQFIPTYVTAGRDATVVYGIKDFKFKNNRSYPVKIVSSVGGGIAKISIYGTKESKEYKVDIKTTITDTIPMETVYIDDNNMEVGKEVITQKGHTGTKSETYKILYLGDKVVSRTLLSKDTYNAMQTVITRGTKAHQDNNNNSNNNNDSDSNNNNNNNQLPENSNNENNIGNSNGNNTVNSNENKPTDNTTNENKLNV